MAIGKASYRPSNPTPLGFLAHAQEFLSAAELLLNRTQSVSLPAYFLFGRSIELSLKAYLLASGMRIHELKRPPFGHDLSALLVQAREKGIDREIKFKDVEIGVIDLLSYEYADKRFEYRDTGGEYLLPLIDVTEAVTRKLAFGLKTYCSAGKGAMGNSP